MARKETITVDQILDTAFAMTREEGFESVTARKVAAKANCSTQPIFRVYKNMEELWSAVYFKAIDFYHQYYRKFPRDCQIPFVNLGRAYIAFAREEKKLFELLFVSENSNKKSMYDLINGENGNVVSEITLARSEGWRKPEDTFTKMWIFIHGAACMCLTGDYDLSDFETMELLKKAYMSFAGVTEEKKD